MQLDPVGLMPTPAQESWDASTVLNTPYDLAAFCSDNSQISVWDGLADARQKRMLFNSRVNLL